MNTLLRKIRVALTPRDWYLKTTLSNGSHVYGKNRSGFGGRGIYIYRDSIEPEFEHLEDFLDPSGVLVDVGANTGIYTIKAAKHFSNDGGIVLAIEPFPDVLASLFHSVKSNHFNNVRLRNFCAGHITGAAMLWMNNNKPNKFSLLKREESASYLSTLMVALDDLFEWEGLQRLDYLKIDVEGAEQEVLDGGKKIIRQYRPIIQIEVNINDVTLDMTDYSVFQAPHSANKVYIPNENSKVRLPEVFGWTHLTH